MLFTNDRRHTFIISSPADSAFFSFAFSQQSDYRHGHERCVCMIRAFTKEVCGRKRNAEAERERRVYAQPTGKVLLTCLGSLLVVPNHVRPSLSAFAAVGKRRPH